LPVAFNYLAESSGPGIPSHTMLLHLRKFGETKTFYFLTQCASFDQQKPWSASSHS